MTVATFLERCAGVICLVLVPLNASAQVPTRDVEEGITLGGLEANEAESWVRAPSLIVGPDERIYIREGPWVRVFDKRGDYVHAIGGPGDGPAEFQYARHHGFVGDTLWVVDSRTDKVALFGGDGSLLRTFVTNTPNGVRLVLPGGGLIYSGGGISPGPERTRRAVTFRRGKSEEDLFDRDINEGLFVPMLGSSTLNPLPRPPKYDVSSNGRFFAYVTWDDTTGPVSITVMVTETGARRELSVDLPRMELLRHVVDSLVDVGVETIQPLVESNARLGFPTPRDLPEAVREGLRIPRWIPPITELDVGNDGSVWLHLPDGAAGSLAHVLTPDGTSFRVPVPAGARIEDVTAEGFWTTETGPFDVPIVRQYVILP